MTEHDEMTAFLRAQHPRIVGLLRLRVADDHVVEELAQDVMVRICQRWSTVSGHPRPEAWVAVTASNLARSRWRRVLAGRRAQAAHDARALGDARGEVDHAETMAVRRAVLGLPGRQREVIALRFYAGLGVRETARAMRCAEGTVKALTYQAKATLRRAGLDTTDADPSPPAPVSENGPGSPPEPTRRRPPARSPRPVQSQEVPR